MDKWILSLLGVHLLLVVGLLVMTSMNEATCLAKGYAGAKTTISMDSYCLSNDLVIVVPIKP